jgi:hypothetical protein
MLRSRRARTAQLLVVTAIATLPFIAADIGISADQPAQPKRPFAQRIIDARKKLQATDRQRPQVVRQADAPRGSEPQVAAVTTAAVSASQESPIEAAVRVDELINAELKAGNAHVSPRCSDEDFLRRVTFDLAGTSPSVQEVTLFGLDSDANKRQNAIDRLLASPDYAANWARYWRDVIFTRATEMRSGLVRRPFEEWMTGQLQQNKSWDEITTALITALGEVTEHGETALIFAQQIEPDEVASEVSRIFLGIQIQCANCHDHPTDQWKREQFHGLAAFFTRTQRERKPDMPQYFAVGSLNVPANARFGAMQRPQFDLSQNAEQFVRLMDRNRDGKISKEEAERSPGGAQIVSRLFDIGDTDKDGLLTVEELKKIPPPMMGRRPTPEYYMPDLKDPTSRGTQVNPTFFLGELKPGEGLGDIERRTALSKYITSPTNPWFAKAFVNRIWAQLVGEGFYMPVDDIGPDRTANHPAALEVLAQGFTASGYDIKWLFRAIANTEAYQRTIRTRSPGDSASFAAAAPVRLRADQIYGALLRVLGFTDTPAGGRGGPGGGRFADNSPRGQFNILFGYDPSTPTEEVLGTVPQALFMMNSSTTNVLTRAAGNTRLAKILADFKDNDDALKELFIVVHAREPSEKELQTCRDYIKNSPSRQEAFEDIFWSLLNSTEFLMKR